MRQTLFPADYEIIVCDDGPTAQAAQVVRALRTAMPGGPLIHYLEVIDTQGPAAARGAVGAGHGRRRLLLPMMTLFLNRAGLRLVCKRSTQAQMR